MSVLSPNGRGGGNGGGRIEDEEEEDRMSGTVADLRKEFDLYNRGGSSLAGKHQHQSSSSSGIDDTMGNIDAQIERRNQQKQQRRAGSSRPPSGMDHAAAGPLLSPTKSSRVCVHLI